MKLREVTPNDHLFVSILLQTAFDGPDQARLVERLRLDGDMAMELLAVDEQTKSRFPCVSFVYRSSAPETAPTLTKAMSVRCIG